MHLARDEMALVVAMPPNAAYAAITLEADADIDVFLKLADGTCLAGYADCAIVAGDGTHSGMGYRFSGDDTSIPVSESIALTTRSTVWTYFWVGAYRAGTATVTYKAVYSETDTLHTAGTTAARTELLWGAVWWLSALAFFIAAFVMSLVDAELDLSPEW